MRNLVVWLFVVAFWLQWAWLGWRFFWWALQDLSPRWYARLACKLWWFKLYI